MAEDKDVSIRQNRRGRVVSTDSLLPVSLPRDRVKARADAVVADDKQKLACEEWGRVFGNLSLRSPGYMGVGDITLPVDPDGQEL